MTVSFGKEVNKGSGSLNKLGKSTANAVPSVQEFSRVIQDAPFGIQGVANNITQLTAQFGNLSKNAGGTKAALKAMLGTLSGPAGILLAVSAVTSLLVSFGDKLKFSARNGRRNPSLIRSITIILITGNMNQRYQPLCII